MAERSGCKAATARLSDEGHHSREAAEFFLQGHVCRQGSRFPTERAQARVAAGTVAAAEDIVLRHPQVPQQIDVRLGKGKARGRKDTGGTEIGDKILDSLLLHLLAAGLDVGPNHHGKTLWPSSVQLSRQLYGLPYNAGSLPAGMT